MMGMAPIIDGMGLIITIFSYNGEVTISSTSDAKSMPDADKFSRYIRESANYLEQVFLNQAEKQNKQINGKPLSYEFFESLRDFMKKNPDKTASYKGQIQFHVKGHESFDWQLNLDKNPALVKKGVYKTPDVTVTVKEDYFMRIVKGDLGFQEAFIQGRIQLDGDISKLQPLTKLFPEIIGKA
jgi:putative sterol carrier protein